MRLHPRLVRGIAAFCAAVCVAAAAVAQGAPQPVRSLLEVTTTGPAQLQRLLAMDLDLAGCSLPLPAQRRLEVVGYPGDLARLQTAGFRCRVLVPDLAAAHVAALAATAPATPDTLTPPIGQGSMGGHYTLAEMEAILDALHQQHPSLCAAKVSIGQSIQGRPLWMVKISDNVGVDENEPEVYFDSLHHAREPLSLGATLLFLDELLAGYGTDPEATFLIDQREIYVVPCVNPDGYEWNRANSPNGGGMWRKNRRLNADGTYGVDLNRNYATFWNAPNGGSSPTPSSDTYRGTGPFSEPESQALEAFAASRQFAVVFSTHTYTDVLLRPFGYAQLEPANAAVYDAIGGLLTQDNGIAQGRISQLLYIASGSSVDHHHSVRGSLSWTAELGRLNEGNFWPVGPKIEEIARRHQSMFRRFALTAGPAFAVLQTSVSEAPGGDGDGIVEPGEQGQVAVVVQNVGLGAAPVALTLASGAPGVTIGAGSFAQAALASQATAAATLTFAVAPGYLGATSPLTLALSGDGRSQLREIAAPTAPLRRCVTDDFEQDRGFVRGATTATIGAWERAAPQATTLNGVPTQPGAQTTPGGALCWVTAAAAGASAGANDVDGGYTDLLAPDLDLAHLAAAEVAFDLWHVDTAANDALLVQLSRDGGATWDTLLSRKAATVGWQRITLPLPAPLTSRMTLRVRAADLYASNVEALVDEFEVRGVAGNGAVTLLGSGALGTTLRLGLNAPVGAIVVPLAALATAAPATISGIGGQLRLDAASIVLLDPQLPSAFDHAAVQLPIPNTPGLVGLQLAFQSAWLDATAITLGGNAATVTVR